MRQEGQLQVHQVKAVHGTRIGILAIPKWSAFGEMVLRRELQLHLTRSRGAAEPRSGSDAEVPPGGVDANPKELRASA